jgi:hypothetical protein
MQKELVVEINLGQLLGKHLGFPPRSSPHPPRIEMFYIGG